MANILVSGYYGFNNAGDEAILGGMIQAVRAVDPSATFTVISGTAAQTRSLHQVEAISRGDFRNIWRAMRRVDLLISGGGSLLQDVTGYRSIPYYLGVVSMAKLWGRPVMFYGQGVGPVTGLIGRSLIPLVGNLVDRVTVRDRDSARALQALGVRRPPIEVTADAALALGPADPERVRPLLREWGVPLDGRPLLGVSVRAWQGTGQMEAALAQGLDQFARETGAHLVFIPMQFPHDIQAARPIVARLAAPATLVEAPLTYRQVQALVGCCDLLVGMRYHSLVFAAMNGVPMLGLSYDPKNDSLLHLLGQEAVGTAQALDPDRLVAALHESTAHAAAIRQRYGAVMARLTPLSLANAQIALGLVKQEGRA